MAMGLKEIVAAAKGRLSGRSFTRDVASTFSIQSLALCVGIANAIILARCLGPQNKGIVAMALLVPNMLVLFLSTGMNLACVYYVGSEKMDVATVSAHCVAYSLVVSVFCAVGVVPVAATGVLARLLPGLSPHLLLLSSLAIPLGLLHILFSGILQGLRHIPTLNAITFVQSVLLLSFDFVLLVWFQAGAAGAILAHLGSIIFALVMLGVCLFREGAVFVPRWSGSVLRPMVTYGLRGHIGNLLHFFNYRLDMFVVNYYLTPGDVGIYTISVRLAELLWMFPRSAAFVIFPKAAATNPQTMNTFTPRVFRLAVILSILCAAGLIVVGRPLISLFFSRAFVDAYLPMVALLPGTALLGSTKILTSDIAGRGYPQFNSISAGCALVLTVVLDFWFIPRYGVLGASVASSIAYGAVAALSMCFYAKISRRAGQTLAVTVPVAG
jgi:O-antigen/teichoic acid export membrane protein